MIDAPGWYVYRPVAALAEWDGTAWTGSTHQAAAAPELPGLEDLAGRSLDAEELMAVQRLVRRRQCCAQPAAPECRSIGESSPGVPAVPD